MKTVHHKIGAFRVRILRKIRVEAKVGSVSLIYDQRNPLLMDFSGDVRHIRNDALISGGYDHHCPDLRMPFQSRPHIFCGNLRIHPSFLIKARI